MEMDTGLECILMLSRFYGLTVNRQQIEYQFSKPNQLLSSDQLIQSGKFIGLKLKLIKTSFDKLENSPLPAIILKKDGGFLILAAIDDDKLLIQNPIEKKATQVSKDSFESIFSGTALLVTRRLNLSGKLKPKFDISWFIPIIKKYKSPLIEVLVASFFLQLFALVTPLFFQVVIDKVLVHDGVSTLNVLAIGLLFITIFEVILSGLRTYVFSHTTNRIDVELGAKVYRHLISLPLAYFESRRVGDSVAKLRELESIRNFLTSSSLTLVVDLFFTIVFFAVLYYYSPVLTGIVAVSIAGYLALSITITPTLRKRLEEKFSRGAENQSFLVETITGIETLKASSVEPQMQGRWEDRLSDYIGASFKAGNLSNLSGQIASFINKVTIVLILWVGAAAVLNGELSVGQLIAFNMIAARVSSPILRLVQLWQDFQQAGISLEKLGDILNTSTEQGYGSNRTSLPSIKGDVTFENVVFRYRMDEAPVVNKINLQMKAGEMIGIVGRSGSGKSTLTKLLQRLYVPESGKILIDGVDVSMVEPAWLRRQVGVVLQENFLFNRSIRENIALSNPAMDLEKVIDAAKLAGAHDFIMSLSEGYDHPVGERGSNLSGGQKQRIAIARALVTNPKILIFDEATSALDYESEYAIQKNMKAICENRTVFIIAHRLSTVRSCDRLIVMEQGRVIEQGSHDELLALDGIYHRLYDLQSGGEIKTKDYFSYSNQKLAV